MPDTLSPAQRHYCMSRIRSKDTRPEIAVRRELWRRGYRYRLHDKKLPGSPDLVLKKYRTVIFVNGCFWHGHKGCTKYVQPKSNEDFWKHKVSNNRERDLKSIQMLEAHDWSIITIWECEISKTRIEDTMGRVEDELKANEEKWKKLKEQYRTNRKKANEQRRRKHEAITEAELDMRFKIPRRIKNISYRIDPNSIEEAYDVFENMKDGVINIATTPEEK